MKVTICMIIFTELKRNNNSHLLIEQLIDMCLINLMCIYQVNIHCFFIYLKFFLILFIFIILLNWFRRFINIYLINHSISS